MGLTVIIATSSDNRWVWWDLLQFYRDQDIVISGLGKEYHWRLLEVLSWLKGKGETDKPFSWGLEENRVGNVACLRRNHYCIQAGGQLVHKSLNGLGDPQVARSPSHPLPEAWWGTSAQEWCLETAPRHLAIGHRWNLPSRWLERLWIW